MGCKIRRLSVEPNLPDSVFVEDTAIVLKELAIVTRPGASSRREETRSVAEVLKEYRRIFKMRSPGTLDGGDVLQIGKTLYVGVSSRTNESGIKQLADFVFPYDYKVEKVHVKGCLHLKSAVTLVGEDKLLINRSWVETQQFGPMECIDIDPEEPYAANALLVGNELVYPISFPKTLRRLESRGIYVRDVDVSELQKAEGAVTCCSLIFEN
jgi:dimethylargininase